MTERYQADNIVISDDGIIIDGESRELVDILQAEAYQVEDWVRNAVIFVVGCVSPIAVMIAATQWLLVPQYLDDGHVYGFGPLVLVAVVVLGGLACLLGLKWPKPWGVVVERRDIGFGRLLKARSKQQAEEIAAAINQAVRLD